MALNIVRWARPDSNRGPPPCQGGVLTRLDDEPYLLSSCFLSLRFLLWHLRHFTALRGALAPQLRHTLYLRRYLAAISLSIGSAIGILTPQTSILLGYSHFSFSIMTKACVSSTPSIDETCLRKLSRLLYSTIAMRSVSPVTLNSSLAPLCFAFS
jgi:hypothetical protein